MRCRQSIRLWTLILMLFALLGPSLTMLRPGTSYALMRSNELMPLMDLDGGNGGHFGDPDDPQNPKRLAPAQPVSPSHSYGSSSSGIGAASSSSWMVRLQILIAGLRSTYWRY